MELAWKACIPQGIEGSNPSLTAINLNEEALLNRRAFLCLEVRGMRAREEGLSRAKRDNVGAGDHGSEGVIIIPP